VWRFAGQSRYLVSAIANFTFVCFVQWQTVHHLKLRENLLTDLLPINAAIDLANTPKSEIARYIDPIFFNAIMAKVDEKLIEFEKSGMWYVLIFYFQWMYVFQMFY
jgi:hypothetical protein